MSEFIEDEEPACPGAHLDDAPGGRGGGGGDGGDGDGSPMPGEFRDLIRQLRFARPDPDREIPFTPRKPAFFLRQVWDGRSASSRFGRFEIHGELGRGAYGVVLLAVDTALGRKVALKLPRPHTLVHRAARTRFLFGSYAPAMLDHPNIVTVHEIGECGPIPYIVFAYHPGPNLQAWLAQRNLLVPARVASAIVAALADGLQSAHSHGVIHRDINPSNVLMSQRVSSPGIVPKLIDFDLARLPWPGVDTPEVGRPLGLTAYLAPEAVEGGLSCLDEAGDIYALGSLLYELLTNRPPLDLPPGEEPSRDILESLPIGPREMRLDVSRELSDLCLACLARRKADRPASAAELRDRLRQLIMERRLA
jgi:serine/threonine protein kinase